MVPSRQRAHAVRLAHAAAQLRAGQRVWASPDVLPIEAWLTREVEARARQGAAALPRLLSAAEEWFLWRQCTAEAIPDGELLSRGALADGLQHASRVAFEFGIDCANTFAGAAPETHLLGRVWAACGERCDALGAASLPLLAQRLDCMPASPVHLAGFISPSPRLLGFGAALRVGPELVHPRGVLAADEQDELEQIAAWCQRVLGQQSDARLLVVLPGAPGARERLATLIRQALNARAWLQIEPARADREIGGDDLVTIEGGEPLAQFPIIAHALDTLRLLVGQPSDFNTVSEWLRSPYWQMPSNVARTHLELWLRTSAALDFDLQRLQRLLPRAPALLAGPLRELGQQLQQAAEALPSQLATAREWSEQFRTALQACHWPGAAALGSREQQTVVRFHELLEEFGQLGGAGSVRRFSPLQAIHWLRELAAHTSFRPGDEDAVVTISPMLADPVVRYDGIWVAGLHAEAFPQPVRPDPFLPLAAQLASGVPSASAAGRLREAHALLAAWRAATDELVLSASGRSGDLELVPSPLLAAWLPEPAHTGERRASGWLAAVLGRDEQLEFIEDAVGTAWPGAQPLPGGTRSIELQNLCAFRAYAELRLGSSELGVPEPGVAADLRGQLLHLALQKLWQRLRNSRELEAQTAVALQQLITRSVEEAAELVMCTRERQVHAQQHAQEDPRTQARSPTLARELRRAVFLIGKLCQLEAQRAPFEVEATELETTLTIAGTQMHLRIDRLDRLECGGRVILDYKSGVPVPVALYDERPSHPQLLAYLAAVGADVRAMATVHVSARKLGYAGIASTPNLLPRVKGVKGAPGAEPGKLWSVQRQKWLNCVEQLAAEFLAGRAAVDPKAGACDFCHVRSFCRIAERSVAADAEFDESDARDAGIDE